MRADIDMDIVDLTNEVDDLSINNNIMENQNGFGSLTWINIKSAFVYFILSAFIAMIAYVIGLGDIFKIDWHMLINVGSMAGFTAVVSILKNFITTKSGTALGIQVK